MLNSNKIRFGFYGLLLSIFALCSLGISAQEKDKEKSKEKYQVKTYSREFCADNWNWSNGDRVSAKDLREVTIPAQNLTVDGKRNGGISVKGENRSDILVRACVQTWAKTKEEAENLAKNIRLETSGSVRAEGVSDESNWSVSYQILVPLATNLKLTTYNGGISISDVDGMIEFNAKNGGISLGNLAGDVVGKTTNGGVHVELSGNSWKGNGLNVETTNGGVHITMPENYAARFETRTVNGGFTSEIPTLTLDKEERERRRGVNISKDLNGGGAPVRVVTTNGGVMIQSR